MAFVSLSQPCIKPLNNICSTRIWRLNAVAKVSIPQSCHLRLLELFFRATLCLAKELSWMVGGPELKRESVG